MSIEQKIKALEAQVEELRHQVGILEDVHAVRTLHHKYGYYLDKCLYEEVVDLYADDGEVRFMGGIFKGKESIKRLYLDRFRNRFTGGYNGPVYGFLLEHIMAQDVITVSPDRKTAKARIRAFMQAGWHELSGKEPTQWWEGGIYENEYVKEDGIWKIKVLDYRGWWHADFKTGWAYTPPNLHQFYTKTKEDEPDNPHAPDALVPDPFLWPETDVLPFHYPHPVTGEWYKKQDPKKIEKIRGNDDENAS